MRCIDKPMYVTVAKKGLKDCGTDQISLTSENANLKDYVLIIMLNSLKIESTAVPLTQI